MPLLRGNDWPNLNRPTRAAAFRWHRGTTIPVPGVPARPLTPALTSYSTCETSTPGLPFVDYPQHQGDIGNSRARRWRHIFKAGGSVILTVVAARPRGKAPSWLVGRLSSFFASAQSQ